MGTTPLIDKEPFADDKLHRKPAAIFLTNFWSGVIEFLARSKRMHRSY
jgi:hypothetical protein